MLGNGFFLLAMFLLLSYFAVADADHSNYDCFACAILTHGGDRDILYARDEEMSLTDFTRPFGADRCKSLAKKPKLFFIQVSYFHQLRYLICFRDSNKDLNLGLAGYFTN